MKLFHTDTLFSREYNPFKLVVSGAVLLVLMFSGMYLIQFGAVFPSDNTFLKWDADWYFDIKNKGYSYNPDRQSNSGFFPFFPYLWKFTGLSAVGISLLNFGAFCTGMFLFLRHFRPPFWQALVFMFLPGWVFMCFPYSEASFFLFSMLLMIGADKQKLSYILPALTLMALTRLSTIFVIPGLVLISVTGILYFRNDALKHLKYLGLYLLAIALGFAIVVYVQWDQTGVWFAYFKAQTTHWYHEFHLPVFKFDTWDGRRLLWLDGSALMICIFCIFLVFRETWLNLISGKKEINAPWIIALSFLSLTGVHALFYHQVIEDEITLSGMNRYVFASSFILVFLNYFRENISREKSVLWVLLLLGLGVLITLGLFRPMDGLMTHQRIIYFINTMAGIFLCLYISRSRYLPWILGILCLGGIVIYAELSKALLQGMWVG